jgi:hypothetical protein
MSERERRGEDRRNQEEVGTVEHERRIIRNKDNKSKIDLLCYVSTKDKVVNYRISMSNNVERNGTRKKKMMMKIKRKQKIEMKRKRRRRRGRRRKRRRQR